MFLVWLVVFDHILNICVLCSETLILFNLHVLHTGPQLGVVYSFISSLGCADTTPAKVECWLAVSALSLLIADGWWWKFISCWHWGAGAILLYHHHLILLPHTLLRPGKHGSSIFHWVQLTLGEWRRKNRVSLTLPHIAFVPLCCFWVGLEVSFPAGSHWQYRLGRVPASAISHCLVLPLCWWWGWKSSFPLSPVDTGWEGGVFHLVFGWSREYYQKQFLLLDHPVPSSLARGSRLF